MNYIVFVYDSLRADHLSHLGYDRKTSPNIDALADEGVSFSKAFSQAYWTGPSAGSIMTSQYPLVHRTGFLYQSKSGHTTIAEPFANQGFKTGCITTASAISESNYHGFGHHEHIYSDFDINDPGLARYISDRVIEWIGKNKQDDFFLFVWSDGTHTPYDVPTDWNNRFLDENISASSSDLKTVSSDESGSVVDLYDENIRYNDEQLGKIVEYLKQAGLYDETTFVITADHGEVFSDHTRMELAPKWIKQLAKSFLPDKFMREKGLIKSSGYIGHQAILPYDELVNVPLIIKSPQIDKTGNMSGLAQTIDIGPSLVDTAQGVDIPQSFQGQSLLPLINEGKGVNEYVYSFTPGLFCNYTHKMIRSNKYKYIETELKEIDRNLWKEFKTNPVRMSFSVCQYLSTPKNILFDMSGNEEENLIKEHPDVVRELSTQMDSIRWKSEEFDMDIDNDTVNQLEDLGYL